MPRVRRHHQSGDDALYDLAQELVNRNFRFELPFGPKPQPSCPVVSTACRAGTLAVVGRLVLAILRSRCAGLAPSLPRR
jgi:hypothetical protein